MSDRIASVRTRAGSRSTLLALAVLAVAVAAALAWWLRSSPQPAIWAQTPRLAALGSTLTADGTRALLVLHHGERILEAHAAASDPARRHGGASLTKALVGSTSLILAAQHGAIALDDPAWKYIPQWEHHPLKRQITILQLASHCSGLPHRLEESEGPQAWQQAFWSRKPDAFSRVLNEAPILFRPGTRYHYSGPGYAALSYAVTASLQSTDLRDIGALLEARLMRPLGIPPEEWRISGRVFEADGLTLYETWSGSSFTARATAAIGQLFLHEGSWQGRPVLNAALARNAVSYHGTPVPPDGAHPLPAAGWWSNENSALGALPPDAYIGAGAKHQVLIVVPSRSLVIVRYGRSLGDDAWGGDYWQSLDRKLLRPLMDARGD